MLSELRTLVLFAEEGSIQGVAERLPLTQPAVTRQIQRLEQALRLELLDRRQKPATLTAAGVDVVARGRKMLAEFDDMRRLGKRSIPEGSFRLGVNHGLADDRISACVAEIGRRFPRVSLRLSVGWSDELADRLERGRLDAALGLSQPNETDRRAPAKLERLAIVASRGRSVRSLAALAEQPWILNPEPCEARRQLTDAMAAANLSPRVVAEVQDVRLQLDLARRGVGLSLAPARLLPRVPQGLVAVKVPGIDLALKVQLLRAPFTESFSKLFELIERRWS